MPDLPTKRIEKVSRHRRSLVTPTSHAVHHCDLQDSEDEYVGKVGLSIRKAQLRYVGPNEKRQFVEQAQRPTNRWRRQHKAESQDEHPQFEKSRLLTMIWMSGVSRDQSPVG